MRKPPSTAANLAGSPDDVEASFYEALQAADIERLMACWADDDEVFCIHPGGPRLIGLGAIRAAFEAMFANGGVRIVAEGVHRIEAMASVVHTVRERIEIFTNEGPVQAHVLATNVFHKTSKGWRMVAHHASPGAQRELSDVTETPPVFH